VRTEGKRVARLFLRFLYAVVISFPLVGAVPRRAPARLAAVPPCADPPTSDTLRFAIIGDYGEAGQPESDVAARAASWLPDLILTVGDDNYPSGSATTIDDNIGQYYQGFICPYAGAYGSGGSSNRFFPALGNHDWVATDAQPYLDYFGLPGNERYYDYIQGPVHFFIIDSDPNEPDGIDAGSTQAAWLQSALGASTSTWDIVLLHHAPYSSSSTHGSNPTLQWPYQQWGADAVVAGHDHTYERLNIGGIPYFVNGLGGNPNRYQFGTPLVTSQVRYRDDWGAMRVDATQSQIRFRFITRTGALIDNYTVSKPRPAIDPARIQFELVASGLTSPVGVTNAGDGSGRLFIVEQTGSIRVVKNGALLPTPFLTLGADLVSGGERGFLSLAFDPGYPTNGYFYVLYTAIRPGDAGGSILTLKRYHVFSGNPDLADYSSGLVLLTIDHPINSNHNGGTLAFGPDGYLYWSTGDGGSAGDPPNNAQNLAKLLGKILRLDVSVTPYAIPPSNPFYTDGTTVDQLIWAYGVRNPWRVAFDRGTGDLYIADVGQNAWEEIDFQPASSTGGENYGWNIMEGMHCYNATTCVEPPAYVPPVAEYGHSLGCSVTGGLVFRGTQFPSLVGQYFYGDFCSGRLWSLYNDPATGWTPTQVQDLSYSNDLSSFGESEDGELYLVLRSTGAVLRMIYQDPLSFGPVQAHPSDGAAVCSTPDIGADLILSDATRDATGKFDISKVKLRLDGSDVTMSATVRVTASSPNSRATVLYAPPSALQAGSHLVTLNYAEVGGPVIAAWRFSVTSGTCLTSTQQLAAEVTQTAAPQLPLASTAASSGAGRSSQALQSEGNASPTSEMQAEAPVESPVEQAAQPEIQDLPAAQLLVNTRASTPPGSTPAGPPASTETAPALPATLPTVGPLGCLPTGNTCPRTVHVKP
jgi:glucose/arabinose dehydrogenase